MWSYDVRNQLVVDVFYDNGTEFIKFTNGKEITVETVWRWDWERVLKYASGPSAIAIPAQETAASSPPPPPPHRPPYTQHPLTSPAQSAVSSPTQTKR